MTNSEEIAMCRKISKSLTDSAVAIAENKRNIKQMLNIIRAEVNARYDLMYIDLYGRSFDFKKYGNLLKLGFYTAKSLKELMEIEELFDIEFVECRDNYYFFQFKVLGDYSTV